MKNLGLIIGLTCLLIIKSAAQVTFAQSPETLFDSTVEKELWQEGLSSDQELALFRAVHPISDFPEQKWESFLAKLDHKFQKKGESLAFIRYAFQLSHKELFKKYQQHATFNEMMESGKFDCVSGTAVLGMILDRYGFDFEIIETDYHVFTMLSIDEQPIVLESTLKIGGMITRSSEVKKYIDAYKPEEDSYYLSLNQRIGSTEIDYSDKTIFRPINLRELAGLQYYNDAIFHFNQQAYRISEVQLKKALELYPSERIEGLYELTIDQAYKSSGTDLGKK